MAFFEGAMTSQNVFSSYYFESHQKIELSHGTGICINKITQKILVHHSKGEKIF